MKPQISTSKLIEFYQKRISINNIAKIMHINRNTVFARFKKANFKIKPNGLKNYKSLQKIQQILDQYKSGISLNKLAKEHNMSSSGLSNLIKRYNIKIRHYQSNINWSFIDRKDDLFFYWLGWMLADGCIFPRYAGGRNRGITTFLTVHRNDIFILEFFKKIINNAVNIRIIKNNISRLDLPISREMFNEVLKWGLIPNKTYKFKITGKLFNMNKQQFLQFLVGMVEGDGCVYQRFNNTCLCINITNHRNMISFIRNRLCSLGFRKRKIISPPSHCNSYSICGKDAIRLAKMLLSQKYHLLNRKWDKCKVFLS